MAQPLNILAVNVAPEIVSVLKNAVSAAAISDIGSLEDFEKGYEEWQVDNFHIVVCGQGWKEMDTKEIAQTLRMKFRETPMMFAVPENQVQIREELKKNGFSDLFYLPMDFEMFEMRLRELEKVFTGESRRSLVGVSTFDIEPSKTLDFEVNIFLPANNRYVKLSDKGGSLSDEQVNKLVEKNVSKLYIPEDQVGEYNKYVATQLKNLSKNPSDSEKLKDAIRNLFQDILSPEAAQITDGQDLFRQANEIVTLLVPTPQASGLYEELMRNTGDTKSGGLYKTSQRVATIAGLLAIGIGHKAPADVVLAALLCDLGTVGISEKDHYEDAKNPHITETFRILGEKKMTLIPSVRNAIQQHHERYDGTGFPSQTKGFKISKEAQLLSFALQFERVTRVQAGQPRVSIQAAVDVIASTGSIDPELMIELKRVIQPTKK